jgi:imidazolonepropionase-like amidohydrolase
MRKLRVVVVIAALVGSAFAQKYAIVADKLYTEADNHKAGTPGVVRIDDGKITEIRSGSAPAGYTAIHAAVVTPGLIDPKTTVGISGAYNIPADQDQDEATDPNTADVRAFDSFNPNEKLLSFVNTYAVTTVQTAPGIINPVAGQAAIFKTVGPLSSSMTAEQLSVRAVSAMVFNLGESPKQNYGKDHKSPGTRMGTAALIRKVLLDAQAYDRKWSEWNKSEKKDASKQPARDTKLEPLAAVVRGEMPAIFNAYRQDDIDTAIRLAREFKLKLILSSVTEGYMTAKVIKSSGAPALVGPTLQRIESMETDNASIEDAAILANSGVPVGIMTGFEGYVPKNRVLLFEAAIAAANGLGAERALRSVTIDAAKILGVADRVGSLEPGKDADVALFDGDPFEYTSHVLAVFVNGKETYRRE